MAEDVIVKLENISFSYEGTQALENVSLEIKKHDFLAIVGPNGSGKSTLLKIILGLIKPNKGEVKIFGKKPDKGRKHIGYLPQYFNFSPNFPINVFDTVLMGRYAGLFRKYLKKDYELTKKALQTVEMYKYRNRQIGKLSQGQKQRVFIARALVREPDLLILDEPTASIDPELQKSFYELLLKLKKEMAIILVTHDIVVVSSYVDKIACLNRKLYYHGAKEVDMKILEEVYRCPIDLIAHGTPHRVLRKHKHD